MHPSHPLPRTSHLAQSMSISFMGDSLAAGSDIFVRPTR